MDWAETEMKGINLGDKRLNGRTASLLGRLAEAPDASIPQACQGWAEVKAAYRFFDNAAAKPELLLAPHRAATQERMRQESVVLLLNDTTELDYTSKPATTGLGPLSYSEQNGGYLHPLLAVTPERLCLGVLSAQWLVRDPETHGQSKATKKQRPIEEKESHRWPVAFAEVCAMAKELPDTRLVYVADRESDIHELLAAAQGAPADLLIRSNQNRALVGGGFLHDTVDADPALGQMTVSLPAVPGRPQRNAVLTLRSLIVTLRPPYRPGGQIDAVAITVVRAREEKPPKGQEPIDWILLTNRRVSTGQDAQTLVEWYVCRWVVEIFFRILKTGCAVESLQLGDVTRLKNAITLYLIVAWRILFVVSCGRACPNVSCEAIFSENEWRTAYRVVNRQPPPSKPPTLQIMIRLISTLGGFLDRTGDGEPGPQTMWLGLRRIHDFAFALDAIAEIEAKTKAKRAKSKRKPKGRICG